MSFEGGVISLNNLVAQVSLYSSDSSVTITPSGQTINLQSTGGGDVGPTGATGETGATGATGATGVPGNPTWLSSYITYGTAPALTYFIQQAYLIVGNLQTITVSPVSYSGNVSVFIGNLTSYLEVGSPVILSISSTTSSPIEYCTLLVDSLLLSHGDWNINTTVLYTGGIAFDSNLECAFSLSLQGPTGDTGATGATGAGFTFAGPTGSVLYYDGTSVTGNTGLVYNGFGTLTSSNGNYLQLNDAEAMFLYNYSTNTYVALQNGNINIIGDGNSINLYGNGGIDISATPGSLYYANISGAGTIDFSSAFETSPGAITGLKTINGSAYPPTLPAVKQATYYKTTAQNLTSGNTDITFDGVSAWSNIGGYITHTNGTTDFTVVTTGLYQLEFNTIVLINNGTWTTATNKNVGIDITRPTIAEQTVITNSSAMAAQNYGQSASGTMYLVAGDIINLRVGNTYTFTVGTPPQVQPQLTTFDLNTFFTWTYVSE